MDQDDVEIGEPGQHAARVLFGVDGSCRVRGTKSRSELATTTPALTRRAAAMARRISRVDLPLAEGIDIDQNSVGPDALDGPGEHVRARFQHRGQGPASLESGRPRRRPG